MLRATVDTQTRDVGDIANFYKNFDEDRASSTNSELSVREIAKVLTKRAPKMKILQLAHDDEAEILERINRQACFSNEDD